MARPKKETEQKVKNLIMLRLTDTQYEIVCEYARLMGLQPAVYVRKVVTEGRHPIPDTAHGFAHTWIHLRHPIPTILWVFPRLLPVLLLR